MLEQLVKGNWKNQLRQWAGDSTNSFLWSVYYGTAREGIMTLVRESFNLHHLVESRKWMIPVSTVIGIPFGYYRNYLIEKMDARSGWKKSAVNSFACATFLGPVYYAVLRHVGAEHLDTSLLTAFSVFLEPALIGSFYGKGQDICRKEFGYQPLEMPERNPIPPTSLVPDLDHK